MKSKPAWKVAPLGLAAALAACAGNDGPARRSADLVLQGAVYTMDGARSWADAVAIGGGTILYVGSRGDVEPWVGPSTQVLDLGDKMVLPGFHDSHVHPVSGGVELGLCDLNGLDTQQEILDAVARYATGHPDRAWVAGGGWDLPIFPGGNPSKDLLDRVVPDRPAYLSAADGHSAWVNSRALEIAGIDRNTKDPPPDGRIEKDAAGEPSGTLRESAMALVSKHLPPTSAEDHQEGLRRALEMANRFGITSLQEASAGDEVIRAYAELARRGELSARVVASLYVDPEKGESQVPELVRKRDQFRGERLRPTAVKIFADGVIESRTAAVLEPYLDRPGERGKANLEPAAFDRLVTRLDQEGFQVHIHAIGDRGVRLSLDAIEAAQRANGRRGARHHIAHLELVDPGDIPRFARLGVVANFQPLWAYADKYITELTEPALGPARSRWLYPLASVVKTGAVVAAGSDWSVSSMNPLDAIQVALTRRGIEDTEGVPWIPEERVDLPTMLAAYTIKGAYLNHQEKLTGSIEVGKAADLIVLDRNLFETPPQEIHRVKVLLTLLEGKEVFRDTSF
jgi:hypothetical protein